MASSVVIINLADVGLMAATFTRTIVPFRLFLIRLIVDGVIEVDRGREPSGPTGGRTSVSRR